MFKKQYVLRRYEPETEAGFPYTDMTVRLNVYSRSLRRNCRRSRKGSAR